MFRIQEGGEGESGMACIMPLNRQVPQGTGQLLECWESETVCHRGQLLVTCRKKEVCSPNVRRNVIFFMVCIYSKTFWNVSTGACYDSVAGPGSRYE